MLPNRPLLTIPKPITHRQQPPTTTKAAERSHCPLIHTPPSPLPRYQSKITRPCGYQMITKASLPPVRAAKILLLSMLLLCVVVVALPLLSSQTPKKTETIPPSQKKRTRDRLFSSSVRPASPLIKEYQENNLPPLSHTTFHPHPSTNPPPKTYRLKGLLG